MNYAFLFNPIFILWLFLITGFVIAQIWNLVRSFKIGKIYNLGRHPLWGIDKVGKFHAIMEVDDKEAPLEFTLARIADAVILCVSIIVLLITFGVLLF